MSKTSPATLAALVAMSFGQAPSVVNVKSKLIKKPCFRKSCNELRTGNKLYCSAECCKLDRETR